MKKIIYTLGLFLFLGMLTSAVNSYENKTVVLPPPTDKTLILPDEVEDYQLDIPEEILEELQFWGEPNLTILSNLDNEVVTLGRVLFYDDRLSGDNTVSCGSCHKQELSFADDVAFSEGINESLTTRNSMGLNDLGWQLGATFFWDMRSLSLEDAVMQPILAAHELGKDIPTLIAKLEAAPEYEPLFEAAFGTSDIDDLKIANALSQFIASIASFDSKHDVGIENNFSDFTPSEFNGKALFDGNCSMCHITPHFGTMDPFVGFMLGNNGLDSVYTDLGAGGWTGDPWLIGTFKSSSLRNIEVTAPYMHDGRFETLEEVIDFYSEGVQPNENSAFNWMFGDDFTGYDFTDNEKEDLLAFLETLTSEAVLTDPKWSNPWYFPTAVTPELLTNIKVYPNPVSEMVIVEFEKGVKATYEISVFDVNGKMVNHFTTSETTVEVPRNNAPSGVYKLLASNGKQQKTFKLIYQ